MTSHGRILQELPEQVVGIDDLGEPALATQRASQACAGCDA